MFYLLIYWGKTSTLFKLNLLFHHSQGQIIYLYISSKLSNLSSVMGKHIMKAEKAFDFKVNTKYHISKMIFVLLYICTFSIIDAGKPLSWSPKCCSFDKWPKSQVFIFHTQNSRNYDYPDCFRTLLTPSLVLTVASCFFLMENTV